MKTNSAGAQFLGIFLWFYENTDSPATILEAWRILVEDLIPSWSKQNRTGSCLLLLPYLPRMPSTSSYPFWPVEFKSVTSTLGRCFSRSNFNRPKEIWRLQEPSLVSWKLKKVHAHPRMGFGEWLTWLFWTGGFWGIYTHTSKHRKGKESKQKWLRVFGPEHSSPPSTLVEHDPKDRVFLKHQGRDQVRYVLLS